MEFREKLIDREVEIANYLQLNISIPTIAKKSRLKQKIVKAHIKNMMKKIQVVNVKELRSIIKEFY
ncbi:MAG: helix-turn-helix transcriptional regulator [Chitinophagaceae bacterium]